MVGFRTRDRQSVGSIPGRGIVGQRPWQVVHTKVPLFTKQYNLIPCDGFHVDAPYVAANGMKSNEQGEYCRSGSAAIESLKTAI